MCMELKSKEVQNLIDSGLPTLAICVADWCPHCQELKNDMETIKHFASLNNINVALIKVTDQDNQDFLTKNPFETLPYCLVFVDGQFKGGETAYKNMLLELIPAISQSVTRDNAIRAEQALSNPEFKVIDEQPTKEV